LFAAIGEIDLYGTRLGLGRVDTLENLFVVALINIKNTYFFNC